MNWYHIYLTGHQSGIPIRAKSYTLERNHYVFKDKIQVIARFRASAVDGIHMAVQNLPE
jgi:hypothetical protein